MLKQRAYQVTYVLPSGESKTEIAYGRSHLDVERQIKTMGGEVVDIEREEGYRRTARSERRSVGCMALVVAVLVLALILYWYKVH